MGAKLLRVDGQMDVTKLIVAFRKFVNEPNTNDAFFSIVPPNCDFLINRHFTVNENFVKRPDSC